MSNLLDLVKDQFGSAIIGKVASTLGVNETLTRSAVDSFIPAVLSGVIDKGSSKEGAASLLNLINTNNLGGNVLDNLGGLLGGGSKTNSFLSMGAALLPALFGRKESNLVDSLLSVSGLNRNNSRSLLSMIVPIALSVIGKLVKSKNWDIASLLSFFKDQRSVVNAALPAGFAAFNTREEVRHTDNDDSGGGLGWLKWFIPLLLIGLLLWYFMRDRGLDDVDITDTDNVEMIDDASTDKHAGHDDADHAGHDHATASKATVTTPAYRIDARGNIIDAYNFILYPAAEVKKDAQGNIVDADGRILIPFDKIPNVTITSVGKTAPTYTVDADGNLVDANGTIIFKKGEFSEVDGYYVDKDGNRIGFLKKIGKAIGEAAEATADAFKSVFKDLFSKDAKVGSTYKISQMDFNPDNHRLTYFSKAEFEGLIAALDEHPNRKLEVRVYTNDGKNEKENQKLSDLRAHVVRDMVATMRQTKKDNISFKGMGSKDASKAAQDAVEVYVAQ